jgi:hypothetical protein
MNIIIQLWGGIFYITAKILLSYSEGKMNYKFRLYGWIIFIIGLPAHIMIFILNGNWIALAAEASGGLSIILGIIYIKKKIPRLVDNFIKTFTFVIITIGIIYSIYKFRSIATFLLEIGVMTGFLIGTYLLAKKNFNGWLWFMLMSLSTGIIMIMSKGKLIMVFYNVVSFCLSFFGFLRAKGVINKLLSIFRKDVLLIN